MADIDILYWFQVLTGVDQRKFIVLYVYLKTENNNGGEEGAVYVSKDTLHVLYW